MNKNLARGLVVGAVLIILVVVLYFVYMGTPPPTGPSTVTAPTPPPAAAPAVQPPPAAPGPKEPPAAAPSEPTAPPKEAAPSPEVRPPEPKVTVFPPEKEKDQYGLLVGRYRKYRDAGKMLARLKKRGIPGFIRRDAQKPRPYEVWAGPFPSQQEAMAAEKPLKAMLKKSLEIEKVQIPIPK